MRQLALWSARCREENACSQPYAVGALMTCECDPNGVDRGGAILFGDRLQDGAARAAVAEVGSGLVRIGAEAQRNRFTVGVDDVEASCAQG